MAPATVSAATAAAAAVAAAAVAPASFMATHGASVPAPPARSASSECHSGCPSAAAFVAGRASSPEHDELPTSRTASITYTRR
jgi:hypothetical protein